LRRVVADRKFRHLLDELSFFENKISLWNGNNIESLSDFDFEVFSNFVILSSKIEPTTRVTNVEHHFVCKIKGTNQVKKFPARQTNMYLGLFLCGQNVSILLFSLVQIFFQMNFYLFFAELIQWKLFIRVVEKRFKDLLRRGSFNDLLCESSRFQPCFL
jgi:hypothetical protein